MKKIKQSKLWLPDELIVEIFKFISITEIWSSKMYTVSLQFLKALIILENILNRKKIRRKGNESRYYHILAMKQTPIVLNKGGYCHICIVEENYLHAKMYCSVCNDKYYCNCHFIECKSCKKGYCRHKKTLIYNKCWVCKKKFCNQCQHRCPICRRWCCSNKKCSRKIRVYKKRICWSCNGRLRKCYSK
jgi:hypothetical protein